MSAIEISQDRLIALQRFGTATIHEAQGQRGAIDPRVAALDPRRRLIGPALTVDMRPSDNLMIHYEIGRAHV